MVCTRKHVRFTEEGLGLRLAARHAHKHSRFRARTAVIRISLGVFPVAGRAGHERRPLTFRPSTRSKTRRPHGLTLFPFCAKAGHGCPFCDFFDRRSWRTSSTTRTFWFKEQHGSHVSTNPLVFFPAQGGHKSTHEVVKSPDLRDIGPYE